ncbi:MAG: hypothetical protein JNL67_20095 [Planctomycetaceae bacterium]|nr:hypothetical protein [Planctomycetaceae bacterium]
MNILIPSVRLMPIKSPLHWLGCWLALWLSGDQAESFAQEFSREIALPQPTVPRDWSELSFQETNPEPKLTATEQTRGYLLFQRPICESVYPNSRPLSHERADSLSTFATPGEFEPLNFAIYPIRKLTNLNVTCSDLITDGGRIPASAIDVRLVTYWNIRYPKYTSEKTYRRLPELLEKVDRHSSPSRECQRWWLTVRVPNDAQPGLYQGKVTIRDEGLTEPVELPIVFRVLGFSLIRDPNKHLSTYYSPKNPVLFPGKSSSFIQRATANEYAAMVDYGLDMFPTFSLNFDLKTRRITINHADEIPRLQAAGLNGPLPVDGSNAIERIIQQVLPKFRSTSHWRLSTEIPSEVYALIEEEFRDFQAECQQNGWPNIVCCPLDEVAAESQEFGVQVYAAVHRAGIRTYATKNPTAPDARHYAPYVDVWCSQPFAQPYDAVVANTRQEYWCYPNHNAGELKDRDIMCQGGRMTYGFGFWRSGYTTLIPWHWAWVMPPNPLDYLRSEMSGCGQRLDRQGRVVPAIYWECFREGFDDHRYLYTLQQSVWEREESLDPACQSAVAEAQLELQEMWDAIVVQDRYLDNRLWPPTEFDARRWRMAVLIEQLREFPAIRQGTAPSVYVRRTTPVNQNAGPWTTSDRENIEVLDLTREPTNWKSETSESTLTTFSENDAAANSTNARLRWSVSMDHQMASADDGDYKLGWPRIRRSFARGEIDLTKYDYLELELVFDSNRDEVQDDVTPLGLLFSAHDAPRIYEFEHDLGGSQRQPIRLRFPVRDLIAQSGTDALPWRSLEYLQFFLAEANYADQIRMVLDIQAIRLVRFSRPQVVDVDLPNLVMVPTKNLIFNCVVFGLDPTLTNEGQLVAKIFDSEGRLVTEASSPLAPETRVGLDASGLLPGTYTMELHPSTPTRPGIALRRKFRSIQR